MPPFGDKLKKEREKRGITLDDVALSTKIGTRFLRAMEEEHFDQLPGGIFNRGFVRAYARCVGLDEDQTIADYLLASGEAQPKKPDIVEPPPAPGPKTALPKIEKPKEVLADRIEENDSGESSNLPWMGMGAVVVVVILGLAIWHFVSRGSAGNSGTSSAAMTSAPAENAGVQTASAATPSATNAPAVPASFVVLIKASEESWISIKADDKPAVEVTLEGSEQQNIEAHSKIEVKVGNLAGVEFWFNGKKLALQGEEGEVRALTFDGSGLRPEEPKTAPTTGANPSP